MVCKEFHSRLRQFVIYEKKKNYGFVWCVLVLLFVFFGCFHDVIGYVILNSEFKGFFFLVVLFFSLYCYNGIFLAAASAATAVPYLDKVDFLKLQNGR